MLNSITSKINPNILIEYDMPQIDIQDYKSVSDRYKLTIKELEEHYHIQINDLPNNVGDIFNV